MNVAKRWGFGLALVVILCFLNLSGSEEPTDSCVSESCHLTVYIEGTSYPFLHTPFEDKQCEECHVATTITSTDVVESSVTSIVQPVMVTQADYQTEHTLLLKGLRPHAAYDIYVTLQDASGHRLRQEFLRTVPGEVQDVRTNDKTSPQIFDVEVGPVSKGVFLETAVTWRTDEPSTSLVEFGLSDRYGQSTSEDSTLKKNHRKNIYELEGGRDYHFRVVSRDIFGNEAVSGDLQFSTRDVSSAPVGVPARGDGSDEDTLAVHKAEVFLLKSELGVHMETSKPARITVEYLKVEESAVDLGIQVDVMAEDEDGHVALQDGTDLNIDACYRCHPADELGVSHPVGMEPSGKTTIPDDLPTLEGGILTCATCHAPHGGLRQYFARKEITKDICISCHEGY